MQPQDLMHVTRVRLAALSEAARVGGQVTAYDLARAVQPVLDLALQVGIEAGRWQAAHAAAIADRATAEAAARATYGPGATEPGEEIVAPGRPSGRRAGRGPGRL